MPPPFFFALKKCPFEMDPKMQEYTSILVLSAP